MNEDQFSLTGGEALARGRHDFAFFCQEFLGVSLHEGQIDFANNSTEEINILSSANGWGKDVLIACKHIHKNFYKTGIPDASVISLATWSEVSHPTLSLAPHSKITEVLYKTILTILQSKLYNPRKRVTNKCKIGWFLVSTKETPYRTITYKWNTFTEFFTTGEDGAKAVQGQSYAYISYDEACRSLHLDSELEADIVPRLRGFERGTVDIISTPDKEAKSLEAYYELFRKGGGEGNEKTPGYYARTGSSYENAENLPVDYFIKKEKLYGYDKVTGKFRDEVGRQVLFGGFVFAGGRYFNHEQIANLWKPLPETIGKHHAKFYGYSYGNEYPEGISYQNGHEYIMAVDTSASSDYFVIMVADVTGIKPYPLVRFDRTKGRELSIYSHEQKIREIFNYYNKHNNVQLIIDQSNEAGEHWIQRLEDLNPYGYKFQGSGKGEALTDLKGMLDWERRQEWEDGFLVDKNEVWGAFRAKMIPVLRDELAIYIEDDKNIKDDCVKTMAMLAHLAKDVAIPQAPESYKR